MPRELTMHVGLIRIADEHDRTDVDLGDRGVARALGRAEGQRHERHPLGGRGFGGFLHRLARVRLAVGNDQHSSQRLTAIGGQRLFHRGADSGGAAVDASWRNACVAIDSTNGCGSKSWPEKSCRVTMRSPPSASFVISPRSSACSASFNRDCSRSSSTDLSCSVSTIRLACLALT